MSLDLFRIFKVAKTTDELYNKLASLPTVESKDESHTLELMKNTSEPLGKLKITAKRHKLKKKRKLSGSKAKKKGRVKFGNESNNKGSAQFHDAGKLHQKFIDNAKKLDKLIVKDKAFSNPSKSGIYSQWIMSNVALRRETALSNPPNETTGKEKMILIYTPLFSEKNWPHLKDDEVKDYLKKYNCPVTNCVLSYDKEKLPKSDVVIFHDRDITDPDEVRSYNDNDRPDHQIWVYFSSESPSTSNNHGLLNSVFDWTMTYKFDSDIWLPYARYYPLKHREAHGMKVVNYAQSKTKLISWLVSNCGLIRDSFVHEMEQHLHIDVAGKCADQFSNSFQCSGHIDCDEQISKYKFYLAFENFYCDYYVTEKYWYRAIRNNVVPIVLGAGPYNDPRSVIPGSYIDVLDFNSIADLVEYIRYLDKNDTAYNEYFNWKFKYKMWNPVCDWPFEPYWSCEICARINKATHAQNKRRQLWEYWGHDANCHGRAAKLREFLERSGRDLTREYESRSVIKDKVLNNNPNKNEKEVEYEKEVDSTPSDTDSPKIPYYISESVPLSCNQFVRIFEEKELLFY
eukprot:gene9357-10344_t